MEPTYVKLEQGSKEWVSWRQDGIGSSAAPIIMYDNPEDSPFNLFQRLIGVRKEKADNKFMARGRKLEPYGREAYSLKTGRTVTPACYEHPAFPHLRCSTDGAYPIQTPKLVVEVKMPDEITTHLTAREGQVPNRYWAQCQHHLMVTGAAMCHYVSVWHNEDPVIVEVEPDSDYIQFLMEREQEFWAMVIDGRWKEPDGSRDMSKDEAWIQLAQRFKEIDALFRHYEQLKATAASDLAKVCGMRYRTLFGCGVTAQWTHTVRKAETTPRGPIDSWKMTVKQVPEERLD